MGWSQESGGTVGLTKNPSALRRLMTSGQEMARLVSEFEASMTTEVEVQGADHHEVQRSFQVSFFKDVKSLVTTILVTLSWEESEDLSFWTLRKLLGQLQLQFYVS